MVAHPARLEGCVLAVVGEDQQAALVVGARCADHLLREDVDVGDGGRAKRPDRLARPAALRPAARSAAEAPESLLLEHEVDANERAGAAARQVEARLRLVAVDRAAPATEPRLGAARVEARGRLRARAVLVVLLVRVALGQEPVREPDPLGALGLSVRDREPSTPTRPPPRRRAGAPSETS